jgi:hypothetical protein
MWHRGCNCYFIIIIIFFLSSIRSIERPVTGVTKLNPSIFSKVCNCYFKFLIYMLIPRRSVIAVLRNQDICGCECWLACSEIYRRIVTCLGTRILVTGYCYGVVSYNAIHGLWPFSDIFCLRLSSNIFWLTHQTSLFAAQTPSSEAKSLWEISLNLAYVLFLSYHAGFFNMP